MSGDFDCGCGGKFDTQSFVWPSRTYCGKCGNWTDDGLIAPGEENEKIRAVFKERDEMFLKIRETKTH